MKILVSAAVALILWVGNAVPAIADPDSAETDPNPFGGIDCSCQEKYPARSPEQRAEIDRGIRDGLSTWSPLGYQRPINRGSNHIAMATTRKPLGRPPQDDGRQLK